MKGLKPLNLYSTKKKYRKQERSRTLNKDYYKASNPQSVTYLVNNITNIGSETERISYSKELLLKQIEAHKLSKSARNLKIRLNDQFKYSSLTDPKQRDLRAKIMINKNYDVFFYFQLNEIRIKKLMFSMKELRG